MFYVHWALAAGARAQLPAEYPERAAYIVEGEIEVGGQTFHGGRMLVFQMFATPWLSEGDAARLWPPLAAVARNADEPSDVGNGEGNGGDETGAPAEQPGDAG